MIRRPVHRGFTLLEVLISVALLLTLLTTLFAFLSNLFDTRDRAQMHLARQRAAQTLVEQIEADALTCIVGDPMHGAGVDGDATSLRLLSRTVSITALAAPGDPARAIGDLVETSLTFDDASGELTMRRGLPGELGNAVGLGASVHRVRLRYLDGSAWVDSFDSELAGRLPRAIEVMVWYKPWPGEAAEAEAIDEVDDPSMPERSTFDVDGGFDERAFAESSDLEIFNEPWPDRVRIIPIPDAEAAPTIDEGGDR